MNKRATALWSMISPAVEAVGFECWGVEILQGPGTLVRVYIDSQNGILVDDCAKVSRQVSSVLDVEGSGLSSYTLEVSSPGLDRPLFFKSQYERFIGSEIRLRLYEPIDGRKQWTGRLVRVAGEVIVLAIDDGGGEREAEFFFDRIDRARLHRAN